MPDRNEDEAQTPAPGGRAEATRQRILDAAFADFSTFGAAGARVDRIAKAAGCNKNLIYIYFGSKEGLFEATLRQRLNLVWEDHPLTTENLPEFAGKTFDYALANPEVFRLLVWTGLGRNANVPGERRSKSNRKVELLRAAQAQGALTDDWDPEFLLTFVMSLATAWVPAFPYGSADFDHARVRAQIVRAVAAVLEA
jgi:AcrR family transcriptional regulator